MNKLVAMLYSFMQRLSKAILAKCKEWRAMLICIADFYGAGIVVAPSVCDICRAYSGGNLEFW